VLGIGHIGIILILISLTLFSISFNDSFAELSVVVDQPYQDESGRWFVNVTGTGFYQNLDIRVDLQNRITDNVWVNIFNGNDKTDLDGNFNAVLRSERFLAESATYTVVVTDVTEHTFPDVELQLEDYLEDIITLDVVPETLTSGESTIFDVTGFVNIPDGINDSSLSESIEIQIGKEGERYTEWGFGTQLMAGTNMFHDAQVITLQKVGEQNVYVLFNGIFRTFTSDVIEAESVKLVLK